MYSLLIIFTIIEAITYVMVKFFKKKFQWIVDDSDEYPLFNEEKFQSFKKNTYDQELGWNQKLDSSGFLKKKIIKNNNYRKTKLLPNKKIIAAFGDSYVFSNHSKDQNTWSECLSRKDRINVLNYGVGNYGLDQSLLKYEKTYLRKKTKIVIMGFVPETILRIQSQWKHFVEFGNTNGFKPCFIIKRGQLKLISNPIKKNTTIKDLSTIITKLKKTDPFYKKRFLKYKFSFPYSYSFIKNFSFNAKIFSLLICRELIFLINKKKLINRINNLLFNEVIKRNIIESHNLYAEKYSIELLSNLITRFQMIAKKRNHIPLVILFPQPQDLELKNSSKSYKKYFNKIKKNINLIDFTDHIKLEDRKKYYLDDKYGGHFSIKGNLKVANVISDFLKVNIKIT